MSNYKTYNLEYIGSSDVLSGKVMKDVEGEQREVGDIASKGFAGAGLGFAPMVNSSGKVDYDKSIFDRIGEDINESVTAFGHVYEKGDRIGEVITEFSDNPGNDFWATFKYKIPYGSKTSPTRLRESDIKQRLVLSLLRNSGIAWFADEDERPPTLRKHMFIVREETLSGESTINNSNTKKTTDLLRTLMAFGDEKINFVCDVLGVGYDSDTSREHKENQIINMVDGDPLRLVFGNEKVVELVEYMEKASVANVSAMDIINKAKNAGLLKKNGNVYQYGSYSLGTSYKDCANFISEKENEEIAFQILKNIKD